MLHLLWDLKLKVGHSVRSTAQLIALAKKDMTVRTAFLEARWLWGDDKLFDVAMRRFRKEVVAGTAAEFVAAKLAERDQRHVRMGDSRYVVEPNVKDGKGGLRDLHTLYWIGKYVHGVERPADLVGAGLLTAAEFRRFDRAERFFWSVRCHLHLLAGRAEERLSFDYQPRIAEIMHYADRPGKSAVERFMQFYFLNAKTVGDLTGVFLAQLDEQLGKKGFRFALPTIRRRPKRLGGFVLDRGRISIPSDDFFRADPVRLLELFALAAREQLEIHPAAMRAATPRRGADRPQGARRPARQRLVHGGADLRSIARARAALDERGRRVRPLRSRLRPRRRADAVRHVPPLYGRRAFDPRDRPAGGDRARRAQAAITRCRPRSFRSRSRRAACSMSRSCCTTSPRAAAATTA